MMRASRKRVLFDILLFVGLFAFPFWLYAAVALAGLLLIPAYFEFLLAYAALELLYHGDVLSHHAMYLALSSLIIFLFVQGVRMFVRDRALSF